MEKVGVERHLSFIASARGNPFVALRVETCECIRLLSAINAQKYSTV